MPPIKLRRLYLRSGGGSEFILAAEPLPAAVYCRLTDAELAVRREAERAAIDAEWARLNAIAEQS